MLTVRYERLGLRAGDRLLDLGCGGGRHAYEALRRGAVVTALDADDTELKDVAILLAAMMEEGEAAAGACGSPVNGDAVHLPFADGTFDRVIAAEVLEHIPPDVAALAELTRVLRPGGTMAVTVPRFGPELINWALSDEYHNVPGGHIRIYRRGVMTARLEAAGLRVTGWHHAHALHSPYWWLKCAVGTTNDQHPLVKAYHRLLVWDITDAPVVTRWTERLLNPVLGKSLVVYAGEAVELNGGCSLSPAEIAQTAQSIADLQLPSGMIQWFPGGHADPWNHVEAAMALVVGGQRAAAERAYEWLADIQHPDGAWCTYYLADGVEEPRRDTNVVAYVATGTWFHYLATGDRAFLEWAWPMVRKAIGFSLRLQLPGGELIWAVDPGSTLPRYALLSGSASAYLSLRCAIAVAEELGDDQPEWELAAVRLGDAVANRPDAFEPKARWAMDWYYPVLSTAVIGERGRTHLAERWSEFVMDGIGVRCVSDQPWVTAAETAECALALDAVGLREEAARLLGWLADMRHEDGSYWTGRVHPQKVNFPGGERSSYTAAAVILAANALSHRGPTSGLFRSVGLPPALAVPQAEAVGDPNQAP